MTEAEALLKIAEAIEILAKTVSGIGFIMLLFLIFKNMGSS